MNNNLVWLGIAGMICICVTTTAAILQGYDGGIITGSIAAITGIVTGIIGYYKGKKSIQT